MYNVNDVVVSGVRLSNLFSTQDEKWHSTFVRPVKSLYSMSRVQEVESNMDLTIKLFFEKLRARFISSNQPCEMSDWINFCEYLLLPRLYLVFWLSLSTFVCLDWLISIFSRLGRNESGYLLSRSWNP